MTFTVIIKYIIFICLWPLYVTTGDEFVVVSLKNGDLKGFKDFAANGRPFITFLSIPYAKPPIGERRFKLPQPYGTWEGIKDATKAPIECSQLNYTLLLSSWGKGHIGKEDCLIVNVFTPHIGAGAELPVMVFIHGGGYVGGKAKKFQPHGLLNEDVILVVMQYRLGGLGFLSTEDSIIPGNLGLMDQNMALRWVHDNIYAFGGDNRKITIFGESAGGSSVHAHILSPFSKGLFSRAILESGTLLCPFAKMTEPRAVAMALGEHFSCFKDNPTLKGEDKSRQLLNCLRSIEAGVLQESIHQFFKWSFLPKRTVPYVDGVFLPENVETVSRNGDIPSIDIIIGVNRNEGSFVSNAIVTMDDQRRAIEENFPVTGPISLGLDKEENAVQLSEKAYNFYVGGVKSDLENYENLTRMYSDRHFKVCSDWTALIQAKRNSKDNKNVYFYELHHQGQESHVNVLSNPIGRRSGVSHADELYYIFPLANSRQDEADSKMTRIFTKLWTNFAKYGNPTPNESELGFKWIPFTEESPRHLKLELNPFMENDQRKSEREFWRSLPTAANRNLFGGAKTLDEL